MFASIVGPMLAVKVWSGQCSPASALKPLMLSAAVVLVNSDALSYLLEQPAYYAQIARIATL